MLILSFSPSLVLMNSEIRHYDFSHFRTPSKKEVGVMWDKSPIAHLEHVKAPTLIALGMKDRRVPPSQGQFLSFPLSAILFIVG